MNQYGKPMVIAELSIIPLGLGSTSVGREVAAAIRALREIEGVAYELTPMGTILEAESVDLILEAVRAVHKALADMGVLRVVSDLRIDDRRDKPRSMAEKVTSVRRRVDGKTP